MQPGATPCPRFAAAGEAEVVQQHSRRGEVDHQGRRSRTLAGTVWPSWLAGEGCQGAARARRLQGHARRPAKPEPDQSRSSRPAPGWASQEEAAAVVGQQS